MKTPTGGHLRKQPGSPKWYGVFRIAGQKNPVWRALSENEREAKRMLRDILKSIDDRTYVAPSRVTFGEYLEEWLTGRKVKPTTAANYAVQISAYVIPALGSCPLQKLTRTRLNRFYRELESSGRRRDGRGLSPKSVRNIHTTLHKALEDAVKDGRLTRNVASGAELTPVTQAKMKVWSADQLRTFLTHVHDDRLRAAWHVACMTGARRAEILGLRWTDIDLEAGRLTIAQAATLVRGRVDFGTPKNGKTRTMSVDPGTIALLREHRRRQLEERLQWGADYHDNGLVFAMENGDPIHPETFSDWFTRHAKAAGLPVIRLHDVRHSYATASLEAGIPAKIVSERLGHANIGITLDRYTHVLPKMDEQAAATVAAMILGTA